MDVDRTKMTWFHHSQRLFARPKAENGPPTIRQLTRAGGPIDMIVGDSICAAFAKSTALQAGGWRMASIIE